MIMLKSDNSFSATLLRSNFLVNFVIGMRISFQLVGMTFAMILYCAIKRESQVA